MEIDYKLDLVRVGVHESLHGLCFWLTEWLHASIELRARVFGIRITFTIIQLPIDSVVSVQINSGFAVWTVGLGHAALVI